LKWILHLGLSANELKAKIEVDVSILKNLFTTVIGTKMLHYFEGKNRRRVFANCGWSDTRIISPFEMDNS